MIKAIVEADLGPVVWDQHGDGGVAAGWGDGRDWRSVSSRLRAWPVAVTHHSPLPPVALLCGKRYALLCFNARVFGLCVLLRSYQMCRRTTNPWRR